MKNRTPLQIDIGSHKEPNIIVGLESVRFLTADGDVMFEVNAKRNGRSIEVRGVDACKVDGVIYHSGLVVKPIVTNSVVIETQEWKAKDDN